MASEDGQTFIRVIDEQRGLDVDTVTIQMQWSRLQGVTREDGIRAMSDALRPLNPKPGEREFVRYYGPIGEWTWLERLSTDGRGIAEKLGYHASTAFAEAPPGYHGFHIEYATPSIGGLYTVAHTIRDHGEGCVDFRAFEGSMYSGVRAVQEFIIGDTVLIAEDRPHKLHDLSNHPIGWLVMGDTLRGIIEDQGLPAIERAELEADLPVFGENSDIGRQSAHDFFYPSEMYLRKLWGKIDTLSDSLSSTLCTEKEVQQGNAYNRRDRMTQEEQVADDIRIAFEAFTSEMPLRLLKRVGPDRIAQAAAEVVRRFELLKHLSVQIQPDDENTTESAK